MDIQIENMIEDKSYTGVEDWLKDIIEGVGGMNDFEEYELVIWNEPERMAASRWTIKCLANPRCKGSAEVLAAIMEQRAELANESK